jgi:catechol 2,3-dioxygenase-like lactoylglutathione lyase family enzyme
VSAASNFEHLFAGIPVSDRDAAVAWYERLLGRPPDLVPNEEEAAWQLTGAGWICVIADEQHAGSARHTLLVDDLDAFLNALTERGIEAGPIEIVSGSVRTTVVSDPDGNLLKVGQPPR